MEKSIISNEVEETRGKNLDSIQDDITDIKEDTGDLEVPNRVEVSSSTLSDESFERQLNNIDKMNFLEVSKFKKEVMQELEDVKSAKQTAESISELNKTIEKSTDDNNSLAQAIMKADVEDAAGLDDLDKFLESFDDTSEKLNKLIEKAEEAIHKFDDVPKTSSFLSSAMLEIVDANIERLTKEQESGKNVKQAIAYYNEIRRIHKNRADVSFILDKIASKEALLKRLKTSIEKDKTGSIVKNVQKNVTKVFSKSFSVSQLTVFESELNKLFDNSDSTFYFQYALYLIFTSEKDNGKLGKHKWVEVLIMNVLDITTGMYDLDGDKELYQLRLLELRDSINKMLHIN